MLVGEPVGESAGGDGVAKDDLSVGGGYLTSQGKTRSRCGVVSGSTSGTTARASSSAAVGSQCDGVTSKTLLLFDGVTSETLLLFDGVTSKTLLLFDGVTSKTLLLFDGVTSKTLQLFDGVALAGCNASRV